MGKNKNLEIFAKVVSIVINPLFLPFFGLIILFNSGTFLSFWPQKLKQMIYLIVSMGTVLLPLAMIQLLFVLRYITNFNLNTAAERFLPYSLTAIFYFITYFALKKISVPYVADFMLSISIALVINIILLFFWKISTHMIGIGGIVGLVMGLIFRWNITQYEWLFISIFMAGIVGFARMYLNAHDENQVAGGFFVGFFIIFGMFFL